MNLKMKDLTMMNRMLIAVSAALMVIVPAIWISANAETSEDLALKIAPTEHAIGSEDAPVQIIEYMSMTCPHCAHFHNDVVPILKEEYIDTGKVRFLIRDLPWDALAFAVSKITQCAGDNYHDMLDLFMNTQDSWTKSENALKAVKKVARMGGMNSVDVDACLQNEEIHKKVNYSRKTALEILKVKGTPTIFINGKKISGVTKIKELRKKIDKILSKKHL